jgi:hypothetical protein
MTIGQWAITIEILGLPFMFFAFAPRKLTTRIMDRAWWTFPASFGIVGLAIIAAIIDTIRQHWCW